MVLILVVIGGILNILLGVMVLIHSPAERKRNFYFSIACFAAAILILFDTLFRIFPVLIILKSSFAFASLVPAFVYLWVVEFTNIGWSNFKRWVFMIPALIFFVLAYVNGLIVKSIEELLQFGYKGELGPLFTIYATVISSYIAISLYLLISRYKVSEKKQKKQIKFAILGIVFYSFFAILFSLILPNFFGIYDFTLLDAPSSVFFVVFTAYAIIRYNMLEVKVVATELFTFALWIFIFIRTILSDTSKDVLLNGWLLTFSVIFGILLIRSVVKEVEIRERLEVLTEDLKSANIRLRELDQQKSEFVSIASHQLRSPLTAIKGYTSMLLEESFGKLPKKVIEPITNIYESSIRLVTVVEDFLNITRIEQGRMKYNFENINLLDIVKDTVRELRPNVERAGLNIQFGYQKGKKYFVKADVVKMRQIISNVVDNSIKYTPNGHIEIFVKKNEEKKKLAIRISDTGIGFSPHTASQLFEKFNRGEGVTKVQADGSGIGLYIAKEMIKAHKGRIWAESAGEGKGATFFIELPEVNEAGSRNNRNNAEKERSIQINTKSTKN